MGFKVEHNDSGRVYGRGRPRTVVAGPGLQHQLAFIAEHAGFDFYPQFGVLHRELYHTVDGFVFVQGSIKLAGLGPVYPATLPVEKKVVLIFENISVCHCDSLASDFNKTDNGRRIAASLR